MPSRAPKLTPICPALRCIIIGAGVAGLTAALCLHRSGHTVTILEKSHFLTETGAALAMGPNASGLLIDLGWNPISSGAMVPEGFVSILGREEKVRAKMCLKEYSKKWKKPWLSVHRVDLHRELQRLVVEGGGVVVLGTRVDIVDVESGTVVLEDGRVYEGDVVIGADGNNSVTRKVIAPEAVLKPWGKSCYRWLVDREILIADPETKTFTEHEGCIYDVAGPEGKFVMYPCRDNTMFNFVAFLPDEELAAEGDDWDKRGNKAKLLSGFSNFSPAARKLLSLAGEDLKVWQLVVMDPLPHWDAGRVALIGDAAHPTLPFLSQGAGLAIEDAISIGVLLGPGTGPEEIPALLKLYSEIRRPRADYVQEQSRVHGLDENKGRPPRK
ncbi:FAD binding domain-containing protein [Dothistroma septosporum NZE10]|uniref:FAD binding domain-containing protein n=1 Tax=Dothistroma septosporum (strain NZE10 / CBS 128990) TaxID=675120 RepID=N1PDW8_DOTSN|nr:FAD binding domain-containing protein [Dothistroma septosporum NZE10]